MSATTSLLISAMFTVMIASVYPTVEENALTYERDTKKSSPAYVPQQDSYDEKPHVRQLADYYEDDDDDSEPIMDDQTGIPPVDFGSKNKETTDNINADDD